jgi:hypothetical protein
MPAEPSMDLPMRRFHETVDMEKLEYFLSENEKYETFIAALHNPAYVTQSFARIARKCGITLHELQEIYSNGNRQLGLLRLSTELPQIMEDVANDAKNRQVVCPRCDGYKLVPVRGKPDESRECPICMGDGTVRALGDKHARDLVFETMKLTNQGGPMVAINQNFGSSHLDQSMESMLKLTQSVTLGERNDPDE